jgi:hypothetical protein
MAKKTVADLLVEILAAADVRRVYGVSGDSLNGITDSIRKQQLQTAIASRGVESAGAIHASGDYLRAGERVWLVRSQSGSQSNWAGAPKSAMALWEIRRQRYGLCCQSSDSRPPSASCAPDELITRPHADSVSPH